MRFWVDKEQEKKPDGEWKDAYVFSINRKQYSTIFTNITNSWYRMDQMQIPAIYEDLFIIGLSIFALDKRVSRRRFKNCWTKLMSVHLRRAEEEAISILKKYRPRRCIIHWFNGNGEQLQQLVDIGCYFSLNSNMVTNEKNKEKLYLIPKTRVLIESDGPFTKIDGKKYTFNNLIKIYELVARYYNEPDIIKMVYAIRIKKENCGEHLIPHHMNCELRWEI